jgi:hypothetical protein
LLLLASQHVQWVYAPTPRVYELIFLLDQNLGAILDIVPPALGRIPISIANALSPDDSVTNASTIASTAAMINQKSGADDSTPPNKPVPDTVVTALDGRLVSPSDQTNQTLARRGAAKREKGGYVTRDRSDYTLIFAGTGTGPSDRDAAVEGTAYLTYTLVPNATYNVDACLDYCDRTPYCGTCCARLI